MNTIIQFILTSLINVIRILIIGIPMYLLFSTQMSWITALYATGGTLLFIGGIIALAGLLTLLFMRD